MAGIKGKKEERPLVWSSFALIITFVCLSLVGVVLVPLLPVKLAPSQEMPGLSVSFSMPGHSARVVETEVTSRLEAMLSRVNGIKNITSTSDNGGGHIRIELDKHTDMDATRFEVSTLIRQLWSQLPDGVSYPLISMQRSDERASRPFHDLYVECSCHSYCNTEVWRGSYQAVAFVSQRSIQGGT